MVLLKQIWFEILGKRKIGHIYPLLKGILLKVNCVQLRKAVSYELLKPCRNGKTPSIVMFAAVISFEPLNTGLIFSMKNICSCKIPDKHQSLPFLQMDKIFC